MRLKWQTKFLIPLLVGITLGTLIIWLVFNLVRFSNKVSGYYSPIIQATQSIYESAAHLDTFLKNSKEVDIHDSGEWFQFQTAILHLEKIVDNEQTEENRIHDLELVRKGEQILTFLNESGFTRVSVGLAEIIESAKRDYETHRKEFQYAKNRINQFSFLVAVLCGLVILFGVISTYREYRFQEASKRELEIVSAITALINALEAKDAYTKGHSARVARYSEEIANKLGLSCQDKMNLNLAALMHDIGKIGVPDSILLKNGPLTDAEYNQIQAHPEAGKRILNASSELNRILPGIVHHHERYDGKGYPAGLKGEKIPLIAQIIAVADSFDAMISSRPYRQAMSKEIALGKITAGRGSQWAPTVVDAFLQVIEDGFISIVELEDSSAIPKMATC